MQHLDHNVVLRIHPDAVPNVDFYVRIVGENAPPELVWLSDSLPEPTPDELQAAIERELAEQQAQAYIARRAAEYPPMQDYIDAQVKKASSDPAIREAGIVQEAAYLAACAAIKTKYPKGGTP
ncbi:MAG: hypothetical protein ABL873_03805 [Gallionella sp.]